MQCAICDDSISDSIQCAACNKDIGYCCTNITETSYRKLGAERKAAWKCHKCQKSKKDASPAPGKPTDLDMVMNELREMKKHLACLPGLVRDVGDMKTELSELKDSCSFISEKLDDCTSRLSEVERRVPELDALQGKVLQLTDEISSLRSDHALNDQLQRQNNIEIKGVPLKKNENLFSILAAISSAIGYQVDRSNVNYLSRVPIYGSNEKLIIVSFINRYIKEDFVASARLKKTLLAEEIGFEGNSHKVFINDHLTPENKKLLTTTKTTLKQKGYAHIWVKYCKIHVRKDDTSKVFIINSERDLNKLK